MTSARTIVRRLLLAAALAALAWAVAVAARGGIVLQIGALQLPSHRVQDGLIAAFVLGCGALAAAGGRFAALGADLAGAARLTRHRSAPASLAALAALVVLLVPVRWGAFVAGGADSYGYVSQADLWAHGQLRIREPLVHQVPWPSADWTLSPLGYRPTFQRNGDIVPSYPPGFPLLLAAFQLVGGRRAEALALPLLGALTIWLTFLLGRRLAGPLAGAVSAIWLASSPVFLYMLMTPMSDVPATVWWLLSVVLLAHATPGAALMAGLAASAAVLTRPNLVPLAAVLGLFLCLEPAIDRLSARQSIRRLLLFMAGVIPGCVAIGALFNYWYGSPFQSGYEPLRNLYAWSHARTNVPNYVQWMLETLTPLAALALFAPWSLSRAPARAPVERRRLVLLAWLCLAVSAVVFVTYAFYLPFDAWWYARFLLPAYPLLIVSSTAVVAQILARAGSGLRLALVSSLCLGFVIWGTTLAVRRGSFDLVRGELKYVQTARYIDTRLPERAAIIAMQHSGSIRYYAGRLTVRYDRLQPEWLDRALDYLRGQGRSPYIVLEDWEEPMFRRRFGGQSATGLLDWPAMAEVPTPAGGYVRVYSPDDRARFLRGNLLVTERIRQ